MSMPWSCRRHACHAMSRIPTLRANRSSTKKKKIEARGSARRAVIHFTFTLGREPARPRKGRAYDVTRRPFETLDPPLPTTGCKSLSDSDSDRRDDNDQRWRAGADGFTMWGDWGFFFFSTLFHTNGFRPCTLRLSSFADWSDFEEGARHNAKGKRGYLASGRNAR